MSTTETNIDLPEGAHKRATRDVIRFLEGIKRELDNIYPPEVVEWIESTIDLSKDPSAVHDDFIKVSPWQVLPMLSQLKPGQETTISAIEQSGKSMAWKLIAIYASRFDPGSMLIVYEEKTKASDINKKTFHPLMLCVPEFAEKDKNDKKFLVGNKYQLDSGWIEFTGAGSDITSNTFKYVKADECDTWPIPTEKRFSQMENLRKRWSNWRIKGLGNFSKCSSIKGDFNSSVIWAELSKSSLGIWHLRCKGCKDLTINSTCHDFKYCDKMGRYTSRTNHDLLKYELDDFGEVDADSCRIVCPKCGEEHTENDKLAMSQDIDQYVFLRPHITDHDGYLNGSLNAERAKNLVDICKALNELKSVTDSERKRTILNSFFGVPMETIMKFGQNEDILESHCIDMSEYPESFHRILMSADSQTAPFGYYYGIRGYDKAGNNWLLDRGFISIENEDSSIDRKATAKALEALIESPVLWTGKKIDFSLIDTAGGSDAAGYARKISRRKHNVYTYKGRGSQFELHEDSKNIHRLVLCNARLASDDLVDVIYNQHNRESNYMYLPAYETLDGEYLDHILNIDPNNDTRKDKKKISPFIRHDYWDIEKMLLLLSKYKKAPSIKISDAIKSLKKTRRK